MKKKIMKGVFISAGILCVVLAFLGIFLPVLPTTPFLLLAAYLFARSSDRFLYWLLNNRLSGSYIRNYREGRGMTLRNKVFTLSMLWLTILLTVIFAMDGIGLRLLLISIATGVTIHISRINTYRPESKQESQKAGEPSEQFPG